MIKLNCIGGIQITLQSDDDADKITKVVHIRSVSDGEYRIRGLSQLSGGQWRRVSLALDLAFTELIRRKGILRSNLMVMDEILTHLDASGREAVGTVLRAMAASSSSMKPMNINKKLLPIKEITDNNNNNNKQIEYLENTITDNIDSTISDEALKTLVGGGSYETVIVILQDLVAMELEEAFDHVDIVVKDADVSKVIIDG